MGENEIIKQAEKTLGYKSWRYFDAVIEKAKIS